MSKVVSREQLSENVHRIVLEAPQIARHRKPGQFAILRLFEKGERIPLTIVDSDGDAGTITLIIQIVGKTTRLLAHFNPGDEIADVVGPLGNPTDIENYGTAVCVGGGIGVALVYPIADALKQAGNHVISIIGARTRELLILEDEIRSVSDELLVTTDDGSYVRKGFVTEVLDELVRRGEPAVDFVFCVGPVPMMSAVADLTRPHCIKTLASLNPIMVDGTGMCGCCRVEVGGETKFACVDGPEFDAHLVDFKLLTKRIAAYKDDERAQDEHACRALAAAKNVTDLLAAEKEAPPPKAPSKETAVIVPSADELPMKASRLPRHDMSEQSPEERVKNFNEVPYGYTAEIAIREASRCLQCKRPLCIEGCPVDIDIPAFIGLIREGDAVAAAQKIRETNSLPAICGRVCPQEDQCEKVCVLAKKGQPVAIGRLERFAADSERAAGAKKLPPVAAPTGKQVAIVGSGPAGLTAAGELAKLGYDVTVFEAFHKAGGVLVYGIPEFRLPKAIVADEVEYVEELGVKLELDFAVGRTATVRELLDDMGYDAVFVGTGAGLPRFMGIPGENLIGVYSANEFLTRVNLMRAYDFPNYDTPVARSKKTVVVGGGNVTMDSARCALRLGADVTIVYRRSRKEMPARIEEVEHAEEEGIEFKLLTNPVRVVGDEEMRVAGVECIRMELGEPDESGRRRPIPIKGSEFKIECDCLIMAIGNSPNPLVPRTTPGLDTAKKGTIVADKETGLTSIEGVYAGGDIVTGAATVILAMGAGKKSAAAIHEYLQHRT